MFYQDWDKFYYPGLENWYHVPAPQYQAQQAPQYHYRFVKKMSCEHSKKVFFCICRYSPKISPKTIRQKLLKGCMIMPRELSNFFGIF